MEKRKDRKEKGLIDPDKYFREDEPYKVAEDELEHEGMQWDEIKEKLYDMAPEVDKLKQELQEQKYADFYNDLEKMLNEDPEFK